jgi:hypothetical protein
MDEIDLIIDPVEVEKILRYLVKVGRPPPGLALSFVYLSIYVSTCSVGWACPCNFSYLLPEVRFLSTHKVHERNYSGARRDFGRKSRNLTVGCRRSQR